VVKEVYAGEDDEETAEEGDCIDWVGSVEAAEEDEGCTKGGSGEGNIVEGVDSVFKTKVNLGIIPGHVERGKTYNDVENWLRALLK